MKYFLYDKTIKKDQTYVFPQKKKKDQTYVYIFFFTPFVDRVTTKLDI